MKRILKTISVIVCITFLMLICSCVESQPAINKYTVTFKDYDETILRQEVVAEGHSATAPKDPERYGYIFIGWDDEYTNITKDTILIAQYKRDESIVFEYTVTFIDYDGTLLKEEIVEEGQNATPPINPEREGYNFIGWDKEYINVTKDTSIVALYEKIEKPVVKEYTVTFRDYDGTVLKEEIVEEGQNATPPINPEREGYNFIGWDNEYTNVKKNLKIKALYEEIIVINKYIVTFKDYNGTVLKEEIVEEGQNATPPINPEREGYNFIGWDKEYTNVESNLEITAQYEVVIYKITLKYINSLEPNDNIIEFTIENLELNIEEPTKIGYNFLGLYLDEELTIPYEKLEYRDFALYAKFEPITYTVTFDSNGGENVDPIEFTILSETILLPEAKRAKYTFLGWYDEENNKITEIKCGTCKDIYLVAKYEKITTDGLKYELSSDKTYYILTGIGEAKDTEIVIPSTYSGLPVTSIGSSAFNNCTSLTSIEIHNSVTSIGYAAFRGCTSLESITLPFVGATLDGTSDTHLGYIFGASSHLGNDDYVPTSLKEVIITGGTSIGSYAFEYCRSLTSIEIPNSVTSIGEYAFNKCISLEYNKYDNAKYLGSKDNLYLVLVSVINKNISKCEINNNTKIIYHAAFEDCTSLTSIEIPDSVTSIGWYVFYNCTSLTSIEIPNSVTSIGSDAFSGCTSLEYNKYDNAKYLGSKDNLYLVLVSAIDESITKCEINENTKIILNNAFYGCTSLTSIEIPNSVTSIGYAAFYKCTNLTSIEIPNSVTSIELSVFEDCTSLTSIKIPNSVTSIGLYAFYKCTILTIYCEATSKPEGWHSDWNYSNCPVVWGYVKE